MLHTYVKWPVFPLLPKAVLIKLTSEIGLHIKYVSVIIVVIQYYVYHNYLTVFDLERIYTIIGCML